MKWLLERLDPFALADGPPPQSLWPFFLWSISGAMHWIWIAGFLSALVGVVEVFTAIILGSVIDSALESGVDNLWPQNTLLFTGALLFFLLLRPIAFGLSSAMSSILVVTNQHTAHLSSKAPNGCQFRQFFLHPARQYGPSEQLWKGGVQWR